MKYTNDCYKPHSAFLRFKTTGRMARVSISFFFATQLLISGKAISQSADPDQGENTIYQSATADAGADQTGDADVTLHGSVGGGAISGTWSTAGDGTFSDATDTDGPDYTPGTNDIDAGTVALTLTSYDPTGPCCLATNTMISTINPETTADAGPGQTVCASSPAVTLAGSVGGGASTGEWTTSGDGTFDDATNISGAIYTPVPSNIAANTVTLTLTSNDPGGPGGVAANNMVINITDNPGRPSVLYVPPVDDGTTFAIKVVSPVPGGTYTLTQLGGVGTVVKHTNNPNDKDADGNVLFDGLTIGKGFSVVLKVGDYISAATDCSNYQSEEIIAKKPILKAGAIEKTAASKVIAAPNPFNDKIRFSFTSNTSGHGSLELYNLLGEKVKTVFTGQVQKGQTQTIEYNVPFSQRTTLIYLFRVGNEKVSGKLIGLR